MKLSDFDYHLPKELIAQSPATPRDHSRLMILDRQKKTISHRHFYNIVDYLKKGDVLVLNNTKVFPARLIGKRKDTGGKVEVFLLKKSKLKVQKSKVRVKVQKSAGEVWEVLIGNQRKKIGQIISFGHSLKCQIIKRIDESVWLVEFNKSGKILEKLIDRLGQVPVPPYIKTQDSRLKTQNLRDQYQTVYAKYQGSVAGPTAGFHFTKSLIFKLRKNGIQIEYVTLHVGLGTFAPVKVNDITKHQMHSEWASIDKKTAQRLNRAKQEGRRIIAVGTTSARTLEAFSGIMGRLRINSRLPGKWTDIFIYPGYQFKFIDCLITNFHLPRSTLLMLISALADKNFVFKAYRQAIKKKYRFYSFGDAMIVV